MSQRLKLSEGAYVAVVLATFIVLGLIGGLLWRLWWNAPSGMVYQGEWHAGLTSLKPLELVSRPNTAGADSTAEWAIIGTLVGLVGGIVAALGARGREYAALAVTLVGSGCAAAAMLGAGLFNRGLDPQALAVNASDGTVLQGRLSLVEPWLLAIPTAMAGTVVAIAFLGWVHPHSAEVTESVVPAP